ncbi:hypothetical protein [Zhihengliuella halotolerans]|uniref:Lipoprotein n=1 Tax=Zhihengliuella halotolerans TaxID=370736 RepID=A0A4Q8AH47_9MICC|nr:hypothetical protein [Zhihengliuella halotolerans]RZU63634.1 hypothetical protein EV380_3258 [Zhihengliuella halotolerans]
MKRSKTTKALALAGLGLTAAALSGCGGSAVAGMESEEPRRSAEVQPDIPMEAVVEPHKRSGELTVLSSRIKESVGVEAFGQSWIEDGTLHVAVTTEDAAAIVTESGATSHLVRFSEADLMDAARSVMAWSAGQPGAPGALGRISIDAVGERIVVGVAPGSADQIAVAFDASIAGDVDVEFEPTGGPAKTY